MTYRALVSHFAAVEDLPIPVNDVLDWIRSNTDHKAINLHAVPRTKRGYRGGFRRRAIATSFGYDGDPEIVTDIMFGEDLSVAWQRVVIVKESTHVFDPRPSQVNTEDKVRRLIPAVILPELKHTPFAPASEDHAGVLKALALLIPKNARRKLREAVRNGNISVVEAAQFVQVPDVYVDIWLQVGDELEDLFCGR